MKVEVFLGQRGGVKTPGVWVLAVVKPNLFGGEKDGIGDLDGYPQGAFVGFLPSINRCRVAGR